jgi:ribosomal protein L21E
MFTIVSQGTFIQPATAVNMQIPLPSGADYFKTINITQMSTAAPTACVAGEWFGGGITAVNDGLRWTKAGSNVISIDKFSNSTASNGFTYVTSFPAPEAAVTGSTITNTTPAVATQTNTYSEGDTVVIYNSVGAEMYSGIPFTISSVSGSGYTLLGLNTPGSAASSFISRRIPKFMPVEPRTLYVTGITQATQGVVTVSQIHSYVVGQKVEFSIPASFGMVQLNNFYQAQSKPIIITAVTAYTFTINVNTTNFTAFAFPATALTPTVQLFATVTSAGQAATYNPVTQVTTGYNFSYVPYHSGLFLPYMYVPAGAASPGGSAADTIVWQAYKMETGTINSPNPS